MTIDEMEDVLERLGIEVIGVTGFEIKGRCPGHLSRTGKEDNNPSWSINADTGAHNCFSCNFRGSLNSLIEYQQGVGFDDVKQFINSGERNLSKAFEKLTQRPTMVEEFNPITESMLSAFVDPPQEALTSRGLTLTATQMFEVFWDRIKNTWIIPMRDSSTGELIGWQEKGYGNRYFNNHPKGMKKAVTLFGYQKYTGGDMIVVESPLDVVRLASVGILGGVATYGCSISNAQLNVIRGADRVVFAMDNDTAGRQSNKELLSACNQMGFDAWFFNYTSSDIKDVGGMSKAEILFGINNAQHSVKGRRAFI